jgi:hypothetical protein
MPKYISCLALLFFAQYVRYPTLYESLTPPMADRNTPVPYGPESHPRPILYISGLISHVTDEITLVMELYVGFASGFTRGSLTRSSVKPSFQSFDGHCVVRSYQRRRADVRPF